MFPKFDTNVKLRKLEHQNSKTSRNISFENIRKLSVYLGLKEIFDYELDHGVLEEKVYTIL